MEQSLSAMNTVGLTAGKNRVYAELRNLKVRLGLGVAGTATDIDLQAHIRDENGKLRSAGDLGKVLRSAGFRVGNNFVSKALIKERGQLLRESIPDAQLRLELKEADGTLRTHLAVAAAVRKAGWGVGKRRIGKQMAAIPQPDEE